MNIPGILKIEKIEFDKVNLPVLRKNQTININDFISEDLRAIDLITDTPGIKIKEKKPGAGSFFEIEIPFTIAGYDQTILDDLDETSKKPHVYIVTEKSGLKYLIGFNYVPKARFTYSIKNDATAKGGRSCSCKISWQTTLFPVFVQ